MPFQTHLADVARAAGLNVIEQPGWKTRGSSTFTPKAVLAHHTAIEDDAVSVRVVTKGRPDLPGPLSHFVLGKDGTVYVIAAGRSNHTGEGVWQGLSGNTVFYGIEAVNKGDGTPWPQVQLDAYYRLSAALLKNLGKPAIFVAGHKEYALPPGRKPDPRGIDMVDFRHQVDLILNPFTPVPLEEAPVAAVYDRNQGGYVVLKYADGGIFAYDAPFFGSLPGVNVVSKAVGLAWTPAGDGYWILGADGAVFSFGTGQYKGGFNALPPEVRGNRVPIGISAKGNGYVIVAQNPDGGSPFSSYEFGV